MKRRVGSKRPVKDQRATKRRPRKARVAPAAATGLEEQIATLTRELKEARAHQAATEEILASLTGPIPEAKPIFDAIVRNLQRLFDTPLAMVQLLKDGVQYLAAAGDEEYDRLAKNFPRPLDEKTGSGRVILTKRVVQFAPVLGNPEAPIVHQQFAHELGFNSAIFAPMMQGDRVIGVISTARREAKPFDEREVALIKAFADQAVIAIENTRLLNELRQRTDDLSESLEQQTATSKVLQVISSSPGELKPVFQTMLEQATRVCDAKFGILFRYEDGLFQPLASLDLPAALADFMVKQGAFAPKRGQLFGQLCESKRVISVVDRANDLDPSPSFRYGGARSSVAVPMLKDNELIGAFFIYRTEVRPFTEKQIDLVTTFAAQAVIAIENTRLLNELHQRTDDLTESLEQQTATSEVLRVISSSPTNVQPVFDAIAESAVRLCDGQFSFVVRFDGEVMDFASYCGLSAEGLDAFRRILPMPASEETAAGRAVVLRAVVEIPDVETDPSYGAQGQGLAKAVNYRSIAAVPLLNEGSPIGAIAVARANAGSFPKRQIVLLQAFADQAVIAIANVRLFDEVQARTRELAKSLDELRTTQDRLVQTQKLALLGQLTAGIAHEIKNPLNFVNNFAGISAELIDELQDTLKGIPLDDKARTDINELTDTLKGNFGKVVHHGRRADAIVKNMLQHSREGSGEHRVIDINALVEESLNLAWHGARAETRGFEIKLKQFFDPSAGKADVFPQDIRRALLNMISNGFYAAIKRGSEINGGDYEPTITASTKTLGDRVEIRIRDNGTGMTPDVKEKIFNPFFTTKPTGEGTGLGLSISHDIIVKQHGGSIEIDTQPGEFTEITVILPRVAAFV